MVRRTRLVLADVALTRSLTPFLQHSASFEAALGENDVAAAVVAAVITAHLRR